MMQKGNIRGVSSLQSVSSSKLGNEAVKLTNEQTVAHVYAWLCNFCHLHLPKPLILCDAYHLAGYTIAEHQGHSTKNQNLAFSAFLGKCQFLDLKRSSPKLGALPKSGSRLGPILIDQA
jgi:hypothetical protein